MAEALRQIANERGYFSCTASPRSVRQTNYTSESVGFDGGAA
jgi:hypothetical protein